MRRRIDCDLSAEARLYARKGLYVGLREKSYLMDKTSGATKKLVRRLMIILILFSAWTISE